MEMKSIADETTKGTLPLTNDMVLCLPQKDTSVWRIRNDERRALVYEFDPRTDTIGKLGFAHPIDAVVLALFDGTRTVGEVRSCMEYLLDLPPERAESVSTAVHQRWREALAPKNGFKAGQFDPLKFVIPADQVDIKTPKLYKPINMLFRVSDDCMRDCRYCNVEKTRFPTCDLLTVERWHELAQECADLDLASVILGGGDPFMRHDVVEIIGAFTRRGIHPFVPTKSMISRTRAAELAAIGLKRIQVSIDSPDEETADYLTNSPGYFRQAVGSIRNLTAVGIAVKTNCVLTHANARQVERLVEFLLEAGVKIISLTPVGRSIYQPGTGELLLTPEDNDHIKAVAARYKKPAHDVSYSDIPWPILDPETKKKRWAERAGCTAGRWGLIVHSNGDVTLCDEIPLRPDFIVGNVRRKTLMEVWNSPRINELLQPDRARFAGTACFECEDFDQCHAGRGRCFRDSLKAYGAFFAPAPSCPRAPATQRLA